MTNNQQPLKPSHLHTFKLSPCLPVSSNLLNLLVQERSFQAPTAERLDTAIATALGISRTLAKDLIKQGYVRVNGKLIEKASSRLQGQEIISVSLPAEQPNTVEAEDIDLEILYEDQDLIAINKPPFLIAHPTSTVRHNTVVNALLGKTQLSQPSDLSPDDDDYRPGIVHRLDKDTSGVMVVAKHDEAHRHLSEAFKNRLAQKEYIAIVVGDLEKDTNLNAPIGRHPVQGHKMTVGGDNPREASTHFSILAQAPHYTLLRAKPHTGRTHQIRVHLAHLGVPILGDEVYGKSSKIISRQALHAYKLSLPHPKTKKLLSLIAPIPLDMIEAWLCLGGQWPETL
jgi:23S rRNA pseudouridine1911/1915/1917 synthase